MRVVRWRTWSRVLSDRESYLVRRSIEEEYAIPASGPPLEDADRAELEALLGESDDRGIK